MIGTEHRLEAYATLVSRVVAVGSWASARVHPGLSFLGPSPRLETSKLQAASVRTPLFFQAECGVLGNVIRINQNAVNGLLFVLTGFSVFNVFIRLIDS